VQRDRSSAERGAPHQRRGEPQATVKKIGEGAAPDFPSGGAGGWETAGTVDLAGAGSSERQPVFHVVGKKVSTRDRGFFSPRGVVAGKFSCMGLTGPYRGGTCIE
jgi:hypothetical protein